LAGWAVENQNGGFVVSPTYKKLTIKTRPKQLLKGIMKLLMKIIWWIGRGTERWRFGGEEYCYLIAVGVYPIIFYYRKTGNYRCNENQSFFSEPHHRPGIQPFSLKRSVRRTMCLGGVHDFH